MKLGDFLTNLARKGNMENDPALISILSNSELSNRDINDDFATRMDTGLMSLDGAKNNPTLEQHFKAITLKGLDTTFAGLADKFEFGDDFKNERSTYKKAEMIAAKIEAIQSKQGDPANTAEKERKLNESLQKLQGDLQRLTTEKTQEIDALNQKHSAEITDLSVRNLLSGKNYAQKDIPSEVNVMTAKQLLDIKLREAGAVLVRESNGELKLKQASNPSMDYVDAGYKTVAFSAFTDKVLADNKLLAVTAAPAIPAPDAPQAVPVIIPGAVPANTSKFAAQMAEAQGNVQGTPQNV